MGSSSNNTDFQSELLRMNGTLQASITELRYHCEVYRLSLKSICKVLATVQKQQDARLRYLTTSRPSFQAYLLNLSQKQALDRIKNVVRKASTFINGYSLVDKKLFQPPPPKPSATRRSGDENKTALATNTTKVTDSSESGWVSKSYSNVTSAEAASVILPVIPEEAYYAKTEYGHAEAALSKNKNGKVERKLHSSNRRRRGGEERRKTSGRSSKSKSRSRSSQKHSSSRSASCEAKYKSGSGGGGGDDDRSSGDIKRNPGGREKTWKRTSSKNCFSHTDSTIKPRDTERKKSGKQTSSKSITEFRNHQDNHHHHRRHQVINSRLPSQHGEKLEEDNETGEISYVVGEGNKGRKQQNPLMSQSGGVANRIPPLLSITTSSYTIKTNKSFGTSHINEKLRAEARRVCRPSEEKQYEGRRAENSGTRNYSENSDREKKAINNSRSSNICAIRLKEIHESKTTTAKRTSTATRRWGNTSTITAGYKVRESLAVVRNRNSGNVHQGQGVVARKYLFSSHKPRNNFKLNFTTTSAVTTTEKVRRIQLNGNKRYTTGTFWGSNSLNDEKPYGVSRKSVSSSISNGNGNGNSNCTSGNGTTGGNKIESV